MLKRISISRVSRPMTESASPSHADPPSVEAVSSLSSRPPPGRAGVEETAAAPGMNELSGVWSRTETSRAMDWSEPAEAEMSPSVASASTCEASRILSSSACSSYPSASGSSSCSSSSWYSYSSNSVGTRMFAAFS
jgi:hypothetical protein